MAELKKVHPNYGAIRLRRELVKEFGKLSQETITRALQQLNLQLPPKRGDSTKQKSKYNYYSSKKKNN